MSNCQITLPQREEPSFLANARAIVNKHNGRVYATWYDVHGNPTDEYTYGKLWEVAGSIAHHLRNTWGVEKGQKVVLCYNFGLHFFAAFLGCLRAGVVAVLVFPPGPPLKKSLTKLIKVVEDCNPAAILTDSTIMALKRVDQLNPVSTSRNLWPANIQYQKTDCLVRKKSRWTGQPKVLSFDDDSISLEDIAFLQYTSGSTSLPKAVVVTHRNITANTRLLGNYHKHARGGNISDNHVGFSWLPQYHDLGLIYASISPFCEGWTMHMMSPISFIKNPLLWIKLMSEKRVEWSAAPNFGYRLVGRKFLEAKARNGGRPPITGLDLSCVHHFLNCAEPIGLETRQEFTDCFSEYGLRRDWFMAGYGLAENVVGGTFLLEHKLSRRREEDTSQFIAVGHRETFDSSLGVKIVDPQTSQEVEDEVSGELWLSGPSKTVGYLGKPELSQEVMYAKLSNKEGLVMEGETYLRTGDLAFIQDDYLFIAGRIKDLIIVNGVNYYPHDFEYTAQNIAGVRPGCIAAFSPSESADGGGEVQIVFEIRKEQEKDADSVCGAIRDAIAEGLGLSPTLIVAIKERTIAKTTSGKIQRRRTRQLLQDDLFPIVFALGKHGSPKIESCFDGSTQSSLELDPEPFEGLSPEEKYDKIVAKVLGDNYKPSSTWEESGLSSMSMVELTNLLSEHFPVTLPPDFSEKYNTPNSLKAFVLGPSTGAFFPVELEDLKKMPKSAFDGLVPWFPSMVMQGMGVLLLFLMFSVATIPAYYFVKACDKQELRILLPLTLPVWHLSFSMLVLLSKWFVIGKYSTREVKVPSINFIRWWYCDRLMESWEFFTGRFLLDTPLLWAFYRLLGVSMPSSVKVDAFLREFDLITIEDSASIERDIRCRKFGPWEKSSHDDDIGAPTLRFRPTHIGSGCTISGHVALGASIGDNSHVEKLSSVPECAQVPAGVIAIGSPAYQSPEPSKPNVTPEWRLSLGAVKLVWIALELYMSASFFIMGEAAFGDMRNWRYATLVRVVLLVAFSTIAGMLACIPLKWLLVGRRRVGSSTSDIQDLLHWMADYHFGIYNGLFKLVAENTVISNVFLMAMGMDIDLASQVWLFVLPPSKVDLVSIKRSFVSNSCFDVVKDGKAQAITIEDCSIGHSIVLTGGSSVRYAEIIPFSRVTEEIVGDPKKWESQEKLHSISSKLLVDLTVLPVLLAVTASLIPTYEFMTSDFLGTVLPAFSFPVIKVSLGLIVHCVTWYFVCFLLHWVMYAKAKDGKTYRSEPWSKVLFAVYMQLMCDFWDLSFLSLFRGTPFFNAALVGLGVQVGGPLWHFGHRMYDLPLVATNGPTIVDSSLLSGHTVVNGKIKLGTCEVSGLLHEGTVCLAHTSMGPGNGEREVGPIHFVSPSAKQANPPPLNKTEHDDTNSELDIDV